MEGRVHVARSTGSVQDYFVELENGRCLFVKYVPAHLSPVLEASEKIASWLHEHRCCVLPLMGRLPLPRGDREDRLWVYWYMPGRPCEPAISDLSLLGQSIAQMHVQLRRNPDIIAWRKNTLDMYHALDLMRNRVLSACWQATPSRYIVNDVVHDFFSRHDFSYFFARNAQPLHGALHLRNFFITLDKNICFFNFSETPCSFEPPLVELSYVLDQLLLTDGGGDRVSLGMSFMEGYMRGGGSLDLDDVAYSVAFLLLKSFCRLLLDEQKNDLFYPQEWDKLVSSIDQVPRKDCLLREMIQGAIQKYRG